jgi:lysylphosphatidylglycerol synthetase-like protein (DUF2156 family)
VSYREFDIISMVASVLLLILRLAIFIHGVLLPDRVVTLAGKAYRRNWSPGTMFVILVVGSGIFFLSLFVLSFIYEYIDSKENQDDRFRRTVIGIVAVFLILCVLGYVAFTTVPKYGPFDNYDKVQQQLRQWEKFKKEHPELFNNKTDNGDP